MNNQEAQFEFYEAMDKDTFGAIVGHYGADYQGGSLSNDALLDLLQTHATNKAHIFKLFGNKLKIEREIDTCLNSFEAGKIQVALREEFLKDKKLILAASLLGSISSDEFVSNIVNRDLTIFNVEIKKGTKLSKALIKLVLPEHQHLVATSHSMANQKLFTKGKLVLSIDPNDYVTMSTNSSGWRSCHRLDGGEFRAGPLAYLRDGSTIICYMESNTPCTFSYRGVEYTHSNKCWRQIAMVDPALTYAIQERQYPNPSTINQNAASSIFKELLSAYNGVDYLFAKKQTEVLESLHIDFCESNNEEYYLYYNDITHSMFNEGNLVYQTGKTIDQLRQTKFFPIKGANVYCLSCGEKLHRSCSLFCEDCC